MAWLNDQQIRTNSSYIRDSKLMLVLEKTKRVVKERHLLYALSKSHEAVA